MPGVADVGHVDKRLFTFDISRCAFEVPVTGESLLMPDGAIAAMFLVERDKC